MDKKKYFFKIIIPNFNNYIYIKKCLDSVLNQTFTDWHCIIVDDLSTDKSDRIAEIYAKRYPNKFTFLRMEEKGHEGGCRNKGIEYPIDCEYYYFIDSDDYLYTNESLNIMFKNVINDKPDILLFNIMQLKKDKYIPVLSKPFTTQSDELALIYGSACTKIIKSDKIIKFQPGCDHAADTLQWLMILDKEPSIKQIDDFLYLYNRNNTNSLTINGKYEQDTEKFYTHLNEFFKRCENYWVKKSIEKRINLYKSGKKL